MEVGFWGLPRQAKKRETRVFSDPSCPEVLKSITFETMGPGEELAAQSEAAGLISRYVHGKTPCVGGDGKPVAVNEALLKAVCRLRWHQPDEVRTGEDGKPVALRWNWLEWVGAFVVWPTAIWEVMAFAASVDQEAPETDPLASDSSAAVPSKPIPSNGSDATPSSVPSSEESGPVPATPAAA